MHILFATDGSAGANAAGLWLSRLPLDADCTVTILTVTEERGREDSAEILGPAAEPISRTKANIKKLAEQGHPVAEILQTAEEQHADLVVLGSHGHSAIQRFLLGSVAERVARHAPCPVLLVRTPREGVRRVLLGVDGSSGAARAADWLRHFPLPEGCEVRLVTVLPNLQEISREHVLVTPPLAKTSIPLADWQREEGAARLAETAAAYTAIGKLAATEIRSGDPTSSLLEVATDEGADLIVVGAHGQSAIERFLLGSVSDGLLRHAPCSVLVVKGPSLG